MTRSVAVTHGIWEADDGEKYPTGYYAKLVEHLGVADANWSGVVVAIPKSEKIEGAVEGLGEWIDWAEDTISSRAGIYPRSPKQGLGRKLIAAARAERALLEQDKAELAQLNAQKDSDLAAERDRVECLEAELAARGEGMVVDVRNDGYSWRGGRLDARKYGSDLPNALGDAFGCGTYTITRLADKPVPKKKRPWRKTWKMPGLGTAYRLYCPELACAWQGYFSDEEGEVAYPTACPMCRVAFGEPCDLPEVPDGD